MFYSGSKYQMGRIARFAILHRTILIWKDAKIYFFKKKKSNNYQRLFCSHRPGGTVLPRHPAPLCPPGVQGRLRTFAASEGSRPGHRWFVVLPAVLRVLAGVASAPPPSAPPPPYNAMRALALALKRLCSPSCSGGLNNPRRAPRQLRVEVAAVVCAPCVVASNSQPSSALQQDPHFLMQAGAMMLGSSFDRGITPGSRRRP